MTDDYAARKAEQAFKDAAKGVGLMTAAMRGTDLTPLLEAGADANARDLLGTPLIAMATTGGNADNVRLLIKNDADVNAGFDEGNTALMACNDAEIAMLLLNAGAKVNARDANGRNEIANIAHKPQNTAVIQMLVDAGCEADAPDNNGVTALMTAARFGCADNVKMLIESGADVNAVDNDGRTALIHMAECQANHQEKGLVVKFLMEAGADLNASNAAGKTAAEIVADAKAGEDYRFTKDAVDAISRVLDNASAGVFGEQEAVAAIDRSSSPSPM